MNRRRATAGRDSSHDNGTRRWKGSGNGNSFEPASHKVVVRGAMTPSMAKACHSLKRGVTDESDRYRAHDSGSRRGTPPATGRVRRKTSLRSSRLQAMASSWERVLWMRNGVLCSVREVSATGAFRNPPKFRRRCIHLSALSRCMFPAIWLMTAEHDMTCW